MDPSWVPMVVTGAVSSVTTVIASSGFWAWMQNRNTTQTATARLLMGLAYDKITQLGMKYIDRGWISKDEYEDFRKYLYEPYKDFGGNGVAEQIMAQVSALPLRSYRDLASATIVEARLATENTHASE